MVNMKVLSDSYGGYFNLLAKIRTLSEQWRSKTSKEKFAMLYSIPQWMFEVVGVRVYGDCQLNLFSNFGHVMVAYYVSMVVYTIYYWSCKGQFVYGLKSLCGMGIMISTLPLYYKSIGKDRFKYRSILNFAGDYMYGNDKCDGSRFSKVCDEGAQKMLKSYIIMTCIMCTSMSLVTFGPMLLFFRTGVWMTPLGTQFPFADRSDIAFYMDLAIQMIVGILGIMISVSIEMSQVIINNVVVMGADVMTLNMKELAEQLTSNNAMSIKVRAKFRNIMIQAEDFDGFMSCFTQIFYWRTFLGPFSLALATAFSIFTQYILDSPSGYGTAVASYIQMNILCFMGQNVRQANEQIYNALNEIPWYLMSMNDQKDFAHLLKRMQNGLRLTIGPLSELNYEMATDLTKRIYQCLMLLVQFGS